MLHLNERELPTDKFPDGILLISVKGLCIGSEQDIRNNSDGYVAFVRQGTDEAIIFQQYINIVLLPHFQRVREAQGLYTVSNIEVPEEHTVVSWSDSGLPQLKNTLSASIQEVYKLKNIKSNKHSVLPSACCFHNCP